MRCLAAVFLLALAAVAHAENWPGWRGPRGDGTVTETGIPLKWTATENVAWKVPLPGRGHSSPIVWGDRVFVTACIEGGNAKKDRTTPRDRVLICVDAKAGKVLWQKERGKGSGSASVTAADGMLYFHYENDGYVALVKASPEAYEEVGAFRVPKTDGPCRAHPVVSGGKLYLREGDLLYCFDVRAKK